MKDPVKQLQQVAALLSEETTLSLATANRNGQVSIAPLFYLPGDELSLYWLSSKGSRHSLDLDARPLVAVAIYRDARGWRQIRGLQMRGRACRVTEPERRAELIQAYCERFKLGRVLYVAARQSTLYSFEPDFIRYIDNARGFGCKFEIARQPKGWKLTD